MDALHFAYWLRGYTEITNGAQPDATQWQIIQDHLNEVFVKVTPERWSPLPVGGITGCGLKQTDSTLPTRRVTFCGNLLPRIPDVDAVMRTHLQAVTC